LFSVSRGVNLTFIHIGTIWERYRSQKIT